MNQALNLSSIRFEPASTPAPLSNPIATRKGLIVEAIRYFPSEDDPRAILGENWIIRERYPVANVLRESTELYSSADRAYDAYWTSEIEWEAWVAPVWASFICRCGCRVSADENPCELECGEKCSVTLMRECA